MKKYKFKINYIYEFIVRVGITKEQFCRICEIDISLFDDIMLGRAIELTPNIIRMVIICH